MTASNRDGVNLSNGTLGTLWEDMGLVGVGGVKMVQEAANTVVDTT